MIIKLKKENKQKININQRTYKLFNFKFLKKLKNKITFGVAILLILGGVLLNISFKYIIYYNSNKSIKNDMIMIKNNSSEFIKQYFLINNEEIDEINILKNSYKLTNKLSKYYNCTIGIYNTNGEYGNQCIKNQKDDNIKDHIEKAKNNKSYIYLVKNNKDRTAYYAYQLYDKSQFLGIVEIIKDYNELIVNNENIYLIFTLVEIIFFSIILVIIYFIVLKSTKSLENLQKGVKEISKGNYNYEMEENIKNDEIDDLIKEYNNMRKRIKKQIEDIHSLEKNRREFFCNVTHELKTPLTSITGYGELLVTNYNNEKLRDKAIASIIKESNKLNEMICNILEVSRGQIISNEREKINIEKLVKNIIDEMNIRIERKNIDIIWQLEEGIISAPLKEFKSVIINLLENAFKYSVDNTFIKVYGRKENDKYLLEIKNTTNNLDYKFKYKAFEPF